MKWPSHIVIAAAPCAVFAPEYVAVAAAGATAPDWLEYVLQAAGRRVKHRTVTHYGAAWAGVSALFAIAGFLPGLVFAAAALSHWFADALTPSGVPLGWWSLSRVHFFGGRIRTGSVTEYAAVGVWALLWLALYQVGLGGDISPWFFAWGDLYRAGVIDLSEWRAHRWDLL